MRLLLVFALAASLAACSQPHSSTLIPGTFRAEWDSAHVSFHRYERPLEMVHPWVSVYLRFDNGTGSNVAFHQCRQSGAYGLVKECVPEPPGRFVVVGPDTTLSLVSGSPELINTTVAKRMRTTRTRLFVANEWASETHNAGHAFYGLGDTTRVVAFFERALRYGELIYIGERGDTLDIVPAPDATVRHRVFGK